MAECSALNNLNIDEREIKLSVHPEYTSYPMEPCFFCIDLKLTAPSLPLDGGVRAPIDLVAVIDRSGSMKGDEIELVKNVLSFIVSHLKPFDRLGIVMYDDEVEEIAPLTKMTLTNSATLNDRIDEINAGGGTNLSGGLLQGMAIMNERKREKADVASVLLFTDGMANVGITSTRSIIKAMNIMYGENKSFTINTFGFGSDHNVDMLREVSNTWNGLYYFIETTEQIPGIFTNCLGGILSTVAQNISLRIEAFNGAKLKEIISRVPPNLSDENRKGEVPIGDIQAEEERDAIVEFHLPEIKKTSSYTSISPIYAKISVEYLNVIKKKLSTVSTEVSVPRSLRPATLTTSLKVDEQRNRFKATEALEKAAEIAEKGDLEKARNVIKDTRVEINNSSSNKSDMVSGISDGLSSALKGLSDKEKFKKFGRPTLATLNDSNLNQRTTSLQLRPYTTRIQTSTEDSFYVQYPPRRHTEPPPRSSEDIDPVETSEFRFLHYINNQDSIDESHSSSNTRSSNYILSKGNELGTCGKSTSATRQYSLRLQQLASYKLEAKEQDERANIQIEIPESMKLSQMDAEFKKLKTASKTFSLTDLKSNKKERRSSFLL